MEPACDSQCHARRGVTRDISGCRLLLLSNSTQFGGKYLEYARADVKSFFMKYKVRDILFIPYAIADYDDYAEKVKAGFKEMDMNIESIHEKEEPICAVERAKGIFIGGGNTFLLLTTLYNLKLVEPIRKRVLEDRIPYMGASAGSNVATVSISTTNDMPICYPPTFSGLCFVPFNINPHYVEPDCNTTCMGETRDKRIEEYLDMSEPKSVLALKEGCMLLVEDGKAILKGISPAKLFSKGKEPRWYRPGDNVSFLLNEPMVEPTPPLSYRNVTVMLLDYENN